LDLIGQECSREAYNIIEIKIYRNFDRFANLEPLEFEVPMVCLVTGCVSLRRETRYALFIRFLEHHPLYKLNRNGYPHNTYKVCVELLIIRLLLLGYFVEAVEAELLYGYLKLKFLTPLEEIESSHEAKNSGGSILFIFGLSPSIHWITHPFLLLPL
jgi:hypothetical protein